MISQSDVSALSERLVSSIFFRSSLADLQKPFASAPMTRLRQPNQRKYKLIPTLLAFPFPVAIHLFLFPPPVRERMKVRVLVQRPARFRILLSDRQNPRSLSTSTSSTGAAPNGSPRASKLSRARRAAIYPIFPGSARVAKNASAAAIAESPCLPLPSPPVRRSEIFAMPCSTTIARWSLKMSASLGISIVLSSNAAL